MYSKYLYIVPRAFDPIKKHTVPIGDQAGLPFEFAHLCIRMECYNVTFFTQLMQDYKHLQKRALK